MQQIGRGYSVDRAVHKNMEGWPLPLDVVKKGDDFTIFASLAGNLRTSRCLSRKVC